MKSQNNLDQLSDSQLVLTDWELSFLRAKVIRMFANKDSHISFTREEDFLPQSETVRVTLRIRAPYQQYYVSKFFDKRECTPDFVVNEEAKMFSDLVEEFIYDTYRRGPDGTGINTR